LSRAAFLTLLLTGLIAAPGSAEDREAPKFRVAGQAIYCNVMVIVGKNAHGTSSGILRGLPIIFYDPAVMATRPFLRAFTYAHECGRHALGHISPDEWEREGDSFRDQQRAADCWAAKTLAASGEVATLEEQIDLFRANADKTPAPYALPYGERAEELATCALK
jgi:hypothetical protein